MSRLNLSAEARLLIAALIGLIAVGVFTTLAAPGTPATPLSVHSDQRDGAMALRLWLEQSGYRIRELVSDPIQPSPVRVLFILDPLADYSNPEVRTIQNWVRRGNTLILAAPPYVIGNLLDAFHVSMDYVLDPNATVEPAPTLRNPPLQGTPKVAPLYRIMSNRPDMVVHLSSGGSPVLVSLSEGSGTVWISGLLDAFSNQGLHDKDGNARLILNLLADVPSGAVIGFDEAHHGQIESSQSLFSWLVGSAPGWGIILALVLTMIFLGLQGRRFGHAVPLPSDRLRREPIEYIQAMANLFRRSGQRAAILKHYRDHLRRRLTERYALDPHLDDVELVKSIVFRDPAVDEATLRGLLVRLSSKQISEQGLITAALDVDAWLKRLA